MSTNKKVRSLVFLDAETTGLEMPRLTELSLVAVATEDLERAAPAVPRVKHKLTVCLNPRKVIDPMATRVSGLFKMRCSLSQG
jgi:three prime repair exonuclease 1